MDELENKIQEPEEQEIDLMELATKLWAKKKFIFKWVIGGIVAGLIIAFSIPKEYTTKVVMAPEIKSNNRAGSGLSSLASLAGINLSSGSGTDAMSPTIYPDIVSSIPFSISLFDVEVQTADKKNPETYTVREYLEEETKGPWWGYVMGLPFKALGAVRGIFSEKEELDGTHEVNPFRLTGEESQVVTALNQRVTADVDNKTAIITVTVTMQDPLVSALLADTVIERLKEYVTNYRTEKAREDMAYAQLLHDEAQAEYFKAQQAYAKYADRNNNISNRSGNIEMERLQNEASLRYNVYNSTAQQLQIAKAKVQEMAPVYTVIEPATVSVRAAKPSKPMIIVGFTFLAFVIAAAWVLFGNDFVKNLKEANKKTKAEAEDQGKEETED